MMPCNMCGVKTSRFVMIPVRIDGHGKAIPIVRLCILCVDAMARAMPEKPPSDQPPSDPANPNGIFA